MAIKIGKKEIWDFWAPRYERLLSQHFALGPTRKFVLQYVEELGLEKGRVLDLGCGVGQLSSELGQRFPGLEVTGVDYSPGMIRRALSDYKLPNVHFLCGSLEDLPPSPGWDLVVSTHSFPYFPDKLLALKQIRQLLKPGGKLCIIHANNNNLYDAIWLVFVKLTVSRSRFLSVSSLLRLLTEAGFTPGITRRVPTCWFIPSIYLVEGLPATGRDRQTGSGQEVIENTAEINAVNQIHPV